MPDTICGPDSEDCKIVYTGHNYLGAEMHWLPPAFLQRWWAWSWANNSSSSSSVASYLGTLSPGSEWCPIDGAARPGTGKEYTRLYDKCSVPLQGGVDEIAARAVLSSGKLGQGPSQEGVSSWSPVYASLPLLRVTVFREPHSWIVSKFFWSRKENTKSWRCSDIEKDANSSASLSFRNLNEIRGDWVSHFALGHIFRLCGEDCTVRFAAGVATLEDLELQADENIRQAFAVVGLLDEIKIFFEMLSARVKYIDTSLNLHLHKTTIGRSGSTKERLRCKEIFSSDAFRGRLREASPTFNALMRLYQTGLEVNRFQLNELAACPASDE